MIITKIIKYLSLKKKKITLKTGKIFFLNHELRIH